MKTCEICFDSTDEVFLRMNQRICKSCRRWIDYWVSLTPEQQKQELRMMDEYGSRFRG